MREMSVTLALLSPVSLGSALWTAQLALAHTMGIRNSSRKTSTHIRSCYRSAKASTVSRWGLMFAEIWKTALGTWDGQATVFLIHFSLPLMRPSRNSLALTPELLVGNRRSVPPIFATGVIWSGEHIFKMI